MIKRAPTNGPKGGGNYTAKAKDRWGMKPPDWVMALAGALDEEVGAGGSQASLGKRIGLRGDVISGVIGKSYAGSYAAPEQVVRGSLMEATVNCPALTAVIGRDECIANQQRKTFSAASPTLVALSKHCRRCPNKLEKKP